MSGSGKPALRRLALHLSKASAARRAEGEVSLSRRGAVCAERLTALRYSEHVAGDGPAFRAHACQLGLEGAISKQAVRTRGIWVKSKCLNREEFVVFGWTDPEGCRRTSAPCSSATTPTMADCATPAARAPA